MKLFTLIRDTFRGLGSLFTGMVVTGRELLRPVVTVQYPRETLPIPARFRGHIEMLKEKDTGLTVCTACSLCMKACPSTCIKVAGGKNEEAKRRVATEYKLDFTKCSLCGACVEVCPVDAIRFSKAYNLAGTNADAYRYDLLATMKVKEP